MLGAFPHLPRLASHRSTQLSHFTLCAPGDLRFCYGPYMIGRLQKHALERLNFVGEVPTAKRLAACKTFLRLESAMDPHASRRR